MAEDAAAGTVVTTLAGSDPEDDALSFAITGGNDAGKFAVDAGTGEITVAAALDYETIASYDLTVAVSDGNGGSDSGTVTVNVTDVAEDGEASDGGGGGGGGCALDAGGDGHPGLLALLGAAGLLRRRRESV